MRYCCLDFEFNGTSEKDLNLVSVASHIYEGGILVESKSFWLHGNEYAAAREYYYNCATTGCTFIAYVAEAESRSLITLCPDIDWAKIPWIDLYLEYRCLTNHNNDLAYGKQYIKGRVIFTTPRPPKWEREESEAFNKDGEDHHTPQHSLASATFKLLDRLIDTDEKNRFRNIIIQADAAEIEKSKEEILRYNESDIANLFDIFKATVKKFEELGYQPKTWLQHALKRGEYAALTAYMLNRGYPVNHTKINKLTRNIPHILKVAAEECIKYLPDSFEYVEKEDKYKKKEKAIRGWIIEQGKPHWRQTDKKRVSISNDAFHDWFDSRSEGFGGAFCGYLKTNSSLNGFKPGSEKKFSDFVGADGRVRPYFNIYGAQSSRSQPGSVGFIPLKSHWMRNFIEPQGNMAIVELDYSSQEFLIAAIVAEDKAMIEAYQSGDVYLAFAKTAGLVPPDATKSSHKKTRDLCKSFVLGISYEMGAPSLAAKMSADTGEVVTETKAQEYIDLFRSVYSDYAYFKKYTCENYECGSSIELMDGWIMWGDNDNRRSVLNMPIQGTGAVIMREAVKLCHERGINIIFTHHDALFAEIQYCDISRMRLFNSTMVEAFHNVLSKDFKTIAPVRVEGLAWSIKYRDFPVKRIDNIELLTEYSTSKCVKDLDRFRQFFT